jgi:putative membrane protein
MPSEGRRLHPASILIGVPLVQLLRALAVPTLAVLAGRRGGDLTTLLLLAVVAVGLGVRVLAWQRFRWAFDGAVVRVEQGVVSRSRRVVGVERVQQVELDRPLVQRLLGVATLRIETAGSDAGPEIELRVLGLRDALRLRDALQSPAAARTEARGSSGSGGTIDEDGGPVLRVPLRRVALAAVTGAQLLLAPALLLGLVPLAGDRTEELVDAALARLLAVGSGAALPGIGTWIAGAAAVSVAALVTALAVAVVRDGGFVVLRSGDDLVLRRGLLGTRESTVPRHRVQVVRVTANPLRRALGVASVRIHSAGGSAGGGAGADGGRRAVVPLVTDAELPALIDDLMPGHVTLPPLRAHPPAARRRALIRRVRGLATVLAPAAAGVVLLDPDGPGPALLLAVGAALVLLQVPLARMEHRALGHGVGDGVLVARHGTLTRRLDVAPLARLQGVTVRASWFQRRRDLATVRAHVAGPGGDVVVRDAATQDAERLRTLLAAAAAGDVRPLRPPAGP